MGLRPTLAADGEAAGQRHQLAHPQPAGHRRVNPPQGQHARLCNCRLRPAGHIGNPGLQAHQQSLCVSAAADGRADAGDVTPDVNQ